MEGPDLDRSLLYFDLSVRARNCLDRLHVYRVRDLAGLTPEILLEQKNCGRKTACEILQLAGSLVVEPGRQANSPSSLERKTSGSPDLLQGAFLNLLQKTSDFDFPTRALKFFHRNNIEYLGDLVNLDEDNLLSCRNLGRKTVQEIELILMDIGFHLGMRLSGWNPVNVSRLAREHREQLRSNRRAIAMRRYRTALTQSGCLEDEVEEILSRLVTPRSAEVVLYWLGLNDHRAPTLERVARQFGITRERVRQIVANCRMKCKRVVIPSPRLGEALSFIEDNIPSREFDLIQKLEAAALCKSDCHVRGILRAASFFHKTQTFHIEHVGEQVFVVEMKHKDICTAISRASHRAVEHWGCYTVQDIARSVSRDSGIELGSDFVEYVLTSLEGFQWLDKDTGWFWRTDVSRNRVLNKMEKIAAVAPRIDISELLVGIQRHHRMESFAPPKRVLAAICEQHDNYTLERGTQVVARDHRPPSEVLSETEQIIVDLFRKHGPLLSSIEYEQLCKESGIKRNTRVMYLSVSPIIRSFATSVYGLIGTYVPSEAVSKARKKAVAQRRGRKPGRKPGRTPLVLISPNGFRIEGISSADLIKVLKELK